MSYYKITFESDTIEGLKSLQAFVPGNKAGTADSSSSETPAPPPSQKDQQNADSFAGALQAPPPTQDQENADAFTGALQAPPPANEASGGLDASDENSFNPPPPPIEDSAKTDNGSDAVIPKPPKHNR